MREYHKKQKNTFEKTKKQQKTKECMLIQIYIYTLKVKENIYTLYSNTNRNTMMEKTTLQLIRKVEEKNKKPANKIESKPGWVPENTESRPSIQKLRTCKKES